MPASDKFERLGAQLDQAVANVHAVLDAAYARMNADAMDATA
jgi:hypothetical protein